MSIAPAVPLPPLRDVVARHGLAASKALGQNFLFDGQLLARIAAVPAAVRFSQRFRVATPDAAGIAQATWIRLPSVTHAFNMNQRINRLAFRRVPGGLELVALATGSLCPPGHYMLFLLNARGVPSEAAIIRIG